MTPAALTLLDEELALLVPGAGPLPFLDRLEDGACDAALTSTARSLLVRGPAEAEGVGLLPAPGLAPPLGPLEAPGPQVHLVCPLPGGDPTLSVLRPLAAGLVHLQDVSEDGVHVLALVPREDAREQLRAALDPLEVAAGSADGDPDVLALLQRPQAAVRVRVQGRQPRELTVVTAGDRCWAVGSSAVGRDGLLPRHVRGLDGPGLAALVERLLEPS